MMKLSAQIIQEYLSSCGAQKRLDPKTLKAYRIDLCQFAEHLTTEGTEFDRKSVKAYLSLLNQQFKPRTVKRKIASLRAFSAWLAEEGRLRQNPFTGLRFRLREPLLLPRALPLRVIGGLLEAAHQKLRQSSGTGTALCGAAVLELLFATGMRVSELCGLRRRDIDLVDGCIYIMGKGSKERVIQVVNPEVLTLLRRYARLTCPEWNEAFFRNRRGGRLSEQSVRRILCNYAKMLGAPMRVTPHMIRHTLATQLLDADVDIRCIQHLLGHSSIQTTQIYTHVAEAKQRDMLLRKHPRNRFSFPSCGFPEEEDAPCLPADPVWLPPKMMDNTRTSAECPECFSQKG